MNIIHLYHGILRRAIRSSQYLWFLVKKPIYLLSYNCGGNRFICKGIMLNCTLDISGNNNYVEIQDGVKLINTKIMISGNGHKLIIRKGTSFLEGGRFLVQDENNLIDIGENTVIVDCFFAVRDYKTRIVIGRECLFSAKVVIRTSDAHSILNSKNERINHGCDTIVGDRVWIGYGANVLKGCVIGSDSIIGTQCVVSSLKAPDGSVVVGSPARIVKQGVHWTKERIKRL